jgi:hypothetical protein
MRLRQNPLWIRSGSRRCLRVLCEDPLSPSELTGVGQLQLSTFGASSILLLKAAGTLKYGDPKSLPCLVCASSRTVLFPDALATSGVGFVQPSSRPPRSPHLKSHSRQRRPTRLQVMTGNRGSELIGPVCVNWEIILRDSLGKYWLRQCALQRLQLCADRLQIGDVHADRKMVIQVDDL